mmetsp:Transcript_578/g.2108  ORF Transcript_578/g.2108 Transcript_578/m.2108 type:complete len:223 (+) Transcript_578:329-997(+)
MDHNPVVDAPNLHEGRGHQRKKLLLKHSDDHPLCACCIGHGAENIESSPDSKGFPSRSNNLHGGMIDWRVHESNAAFVHALRDVLWFQLNLHSQGLQHVCRSTLGRHRPIASLANPAACSSGQNCRCSGDIDRMGPVASGAHDVQKLAACRNWPTGLVHRPHHPRDLLGSLAFGAEQRKQSCHLCRVGTSEDQIPGRFCLRRGERLPGHQILQVWLEGCPGD